MADTQSSYLGCIATTRKRRAGEDWHRGRDLMDGSFCYNTWEAMLRDMLAYELIDKPVKTVQEVVERSN